MDLDIKVAYVSDRDGDPGHVPLGPRPPRLSIAISVLGGVIVLPTPRPSGSGESGH